MTVRAWRCLFRNFCWGGSGCCHSSLAICHHRVLEEILPGSLIWKARQDSLWQPLLRPLLFLPAVSMAALLVWSGSGADLCAASLGHKGSVRSLCCWRSVSTHSWRRALASWCDCCVLEEPCIPSAGELGAGSEQRMLPGRSDNPGAVTGK